jgi:hypothetical protein
MSDDEKSQQRKKSSRLSGNKENESAMDVSISDVRKSTINISGGDIYNTNDEVFSTDDKISRSIQDELSRQRAMITDEEDKGKKASRKLRVFLCHSANDKPVVRKLYNKLNAEAWIDPWFDEENLLPGQDWDFEIKKAVRAADVIIVCLSKGSVNKEGYVQKEIKMALDIADEKPEGTIFVLPSKLEECSMPDRLSRWQWLNYFETNAYEKLIRALKKRASTLGITTN